MGASREKEVNTNGAESRTTKDPFCPECRQSEAQSVIRTECGGPGSPPKARSFVRALRGAGQGCAPWPGAAPDRGPLPRAAPRHQASLSRPLSPPPPLPPSPTPATLPRPRLTSQQHAEAAGQEAPQHGPHLPRSARARDPHRRPAARGRASEEPGRPPQRRVCTLMLSAAGRRRPRRRKKRAHVRALARRSGPGSRDASACPHAAASSRGAPRPPRGASFSLFLSLRRRDSPRGRCRLPARPTPPRHAAAGAREPPPLRAPTPHRVSPRDGPREPRQADGERSSRGAFQWDSFPGRRRA